MSHNAKIPQNIFSVAWATLALPIPYRQKFLQYTGKAIPGLYRGQPASMLHGAGRDEGAWSRWDHQSDVWAASGGTSPHAAYEAASHVVSAPSGTAGRDSQGGRYHTAPGGELHGRQDRPGDGSPHPGSDLRARVPRDVVWLSTGAELS